VLTFKPHPKAVHGLAFSPDGNRLATACCYDAVRVWNLDGPTPVTDFPAVAALPFQPVAFSPDGRFLARGGADFAVWELKTGNLLAISDSTSHSVAFAPDGKEVAMFGAENPIERWALPSGKELAGGWGGSRTKERFPAGAMTYSPDGKSIATVYGVRGENGYDSHILLWGRNTGKPRLQIVADFRFAHPAAIAYSPDGSVIAGIYGPVLGVVEVKTGKKLAAIKPGKQHFKGLAFAPDGRRLIAVNNDAAVRVYDTATWKETTGYAWQIGKLTAVAVAPDGLRAACGSDKGRVVVWDLE
jgi:WD40 repeat protein